MAIKEYCGLSIMKRIEAILSMKGVRLIIGFTLFVLAFISYFYIVSIYDQNDLFDDSVSWFHKHVFDRFNSGNNLLVDYNLRLIEGRDLTRSYVLIDYFLKGLGMSNATLLFGFIYIVLVAVASYLFFKDLVSAGFSTLLFVTTPSVLYWFKHNIYGSYIMQAIWLLPIIVTWYSIRKNNILLGIISALIVGFLWLTWPGSWFLVLLYAVYLGGLVYMGRVNRLDLLVSLAILLFTLPLNVLLGLYSIVSYHLLAYILLLSYTVIGYAEYYSMKNLGRIERNVWRIIGVLSGVGIALGVMGLITPLNASMGYYEDYFKAYNPFIDYGILSILALFAIALILRSHIIRDIRERFLGFIIAVSVILGIIVSYVDPTLSVLTASGLAILVSYGLIRILVFTYKNSTSRLRIVYLVIVLWIITGSVVASVAPGLTYANRTPAIYYADLPVEAANRTLTYSPFIQALESISENATSGKVIVIAYWGLSYWIVGYLDRNTYTLADMVGSPQGWRIISWILTSDEETALGFINQLTGNNTDVDVYVLVTGVFSVEVTAGITGGANAHLGYPVVLPPVRPGEQPQVLYRPMGDMERIPLYIVTAGKNPNDYIDFPKTQYSFQTGLAWKSTLSNSVIGKLLTYAIKELNYTVINDVVSPIPMTVKAPKYFKLVNVSSIPIRMVDTGTSKLQIDYFVAVYKVAK